MFFSLHPASAFVVFLTPFLLKMSAFMGGTHTFLDAEQTERSRNDRACIGDVAAARCPAYHVRNGTGIGRMMRKVQGPPSLAMMVRLDMRHQNL